MFASGDFVRATDAPPPGAAWAAPRQTVVINTDDYTLREISRARELNVSGLFGALDNKRPRAWDQYGYPEQVTFAALLQAYERGGAGHGAVHRILDNCWSTWPRIKKPGADEESEWEKKTAKVFSDLGLWRKLRDLDRRNLVGRYAGLIYRVADRAHELREPLRSGKLVDVVPLYESQIEPTQWDQDQASPRFGQPVMYQYRARRPESLAKTGAPGQPDMQVDVHWTRVQIFAEGSIGDMFDGVPLLRAGYNHLIELEKIAGGSAEGFLKNSARTLSIEVEGTTSLRALAATPGTAITSDVQAGELLNDKVRAVNRNQDSALILGGAKANTLQTQQITPGPAFEVAANLFAASVRYPFTVLFGQQTGRLASDEDRKDANARCSSRQANELTPMLEEFVRRMQAIGVIEAGEFEVEWAPLDALGEKDKAEILGKYTAAMQQAAGAGITEPIFDSDELRGLVGFDPRGDDGTQQEGDLTPEDRAAAEAAARAGQAAPSQQGGRVALRAAA